MSHTRRKTDKLAISAIVSTVVGVVLLMTYVINTSRWVQQVDDTIVMCKMMIETVSEQTIRNKDHIVILEGEAKEDQRFQGEVAAQIDQIQASLVRQESVLHQLIINSQIIMKGNGLGK